MADETAAVTDSTAPAEAATTDSGGQAVAQDGVTHGDDAAETTTTDAEPAEGADDSDADLDDDEDASSEGQTDEEKTKAQKRRERRIAREQERINTAVQSELAKVRSEQETAAAQTRQQAAAQAAAQERNKRLIEFVGEASSDGKPGTVETLQSELAEINRQIRTELVQPAGADLDALTQQAAEAEGKIARILENRTMATEIEEFVHSHKAAEFLDALKWPEFSDETTRSAYLKVQGNVTATLALIRQALTAAKDAEITAVTKTLTDKHTSERKALESDRNAWKARAAGEEVPDTTNGGQPGTSAGIFTREQLATMPLDVYRRNKAEIERQDLAGLIR